MLSLKVSTSSSEDMFNNSRRDTSSKRFSRSFNSGTVSVNTVYFFFLGVALAGLTDLAAAASTLARSRNLAIAN